NITTGKDTSWLQVEVCREFLRSKCARDEGECRYAHPGNNIQIDNGFVTACYDSIKNRCNREVCKYFHPPKHLKIQLENNGRLNLRQQQQHQQQQQQQRQMQQQLLLTTGPPFVGQPIVNIKEGIHYNRFLPYSAPFVSIVPALYPEYVTSAPLEPILINNAIGNSMPKKPAKVDRMEVCRQYRRGTCSRGEDECRYAHPPTNVVIDKYDNTVTLCMDHIKGKCQRDVCRYFHPPPHLLTRVKQQQAQ
ncbi:uncharacterized protein TRIADDRAFT_4444, partial [Trichoplax adhaerens]